MKTTVLTSLAEVDVGRQCEHGSFSVQVSAPGVWRINGLPPIETEAEDFFVFFPNGECPCWEEVA